MRSSPTKDPEELDELAEELSILYEIFRISDTAGADAQHNRLSILYEIFERDGTLQREQKKQTFNSI